jgi:hypothetical protein
MCLSIFFWTKVRAYLSHDREQKQAEINFRYFAFVMFAIITESHKVKEEDAKTDKIELNILRIWLWKQL